MLEICSLRFDVMNRGKYVSSEFSLVGLYSLIDGNKIVREIRKLSIWSFRSFVCDEISVLQLLLQVVEKFNFVLSVEKRFRNHVLLDTSLAISYTSIGVARSALEGA